MTGVRRCPWVLPPTVLPYPSPQLPDLGGPCPALCEQVVARLPLPAVVVCVRRACGADGADDADGDASEAGRRGGALFIKRPLPLLAPPFLASLPPLASLFAKASAVEKVAVPAHGLPLHT